MQMLQCLRGRVCVQMTEKRVMTTGIFWDLITTIVLFMPPTHSIAELMNRDVTIMNPQ